MVSTTTNNNNNSRDGQDRTRGRSDGGVRHTLKKGPWTTAEDAILIDYVQKHGEGNWNAVQRNSSLLRCGKSCRLRWANHLRPNLKKGSFTPNEERLIMELHAKIGNKWARMASQLPGRTDNEIKNYWNTRVKRLQRTGLPIYPDGIPHIYQPSHQNEQIITNPTSPISPPAPYSSQFNTSIPFLNPMLNFPRMVNSSFLSHPNLRIIRNHPIPLTNSISQFTLPPSSIFERDNHMAGFFSPFSLINRPENVELPSIQTRGMEAFTSIRTPSSPMISGSGSGSDSGSGDQYDIGAQEKNYCANNTFKEENNSGLLDALLEESNALVQSQKAKRQSSLGDGKGKEISEEDGSNGAVDSSSLHSSCGMKEEPAMEEMNHMDDDLSSLLNNFPLTETIPDWYETTTTANVNDHNKEQNNIGLVADQAAPQQPKYGMSSCCWNNMPSIC